MLISNTVTLKITFMLYIIEYLTIKKYQSVKLPENVGQVFWLISYKFYYAPDIVPHSFSYASISETNAYQNTVYLTDVCGGECSTPFPSCNKPITPATSWPANEKSPSKYWSTPHLWIGINPIYQPTFCAVASGWSYIRLLKVILADSLVNLMSESDGRYTESGNRSSQREKWKDKTLYKDNSFPNDISLYRVKWVYIHYWGTAKILILCRTSELYCLFTYST